jgi:hypothetical protein
MGRAIDGDQRLGDAEIGHVDDRAGVLALHEDPLPRGADGRNCPNAYSTIVLVQDSRSMEIPRRYVDRLKQIAEEKIARDGRVGSGAGDDKSHEEGSALRWLTLARAILEDIFPPGHAVLAEFARVTRDDPGFRAWTPEAMRRARGTVQAALTLVDGGDVGSIVDGVRSETTLEILEQADTLVSKGYHVAGAVLAGGALETHLRHLCDRAAVSFKPPGSISAYNDGIAAHAKTGGAVYSANDVKLVTAWGGFRNRAAHQPLDFEKEADAAAVRGTINAIREFIARTT